jgi:hypothetical protein
VVPVPHRTTRLTVPLVVFTGAAAVGLGVGWAERPPEPSAPPAAARPADDAGAAVPAAPAPAAAASPGLVRVDFAFTRRSGHAGNQFAVWVEDAAGRHVRSLLATSFTAEGGWNRRPMSLPAWRAAAGWDRAPEELVRAVSRPAPESGPQTVFWDGLDAAGAPAAPGVYRVRVEGNLLWENRVLLAADVAVGPAGAQAPVPSGPPAFEPAAAAGLPPVLEDLRVGFLPGEALDPALVSTYSRGS